MRARGKSVSEMQHRKFRYSFTALGIVKQGLTAKAIIICSEIFRKIMELQILLHKQRIWQKAFLTIQRNFRSSKILRIDMEKMILAYWDKLYEDINTKSLEYDSASKIHSILKKIAKVPEEIKQAVAKFYIKKCSFLHAICFL